MMMFPQILSLLVKSVKSVFISLITETNSKSSTLSEVSSLNNVPVFGLLICSLWDFSCIMGIMSSFYHLPPPPHSLFIALFFSFFLHLLFLLFPSISGVGQQQEAGQAEADRGEPRAPSTGGAAEDGVGPTGPHPGRVGPHPHGDWGSHVHKRTGQPLEAETEIPGETSPSLPASLLTTASIVLITLSHPSLPPSPTPPSQTPPHHPPCLLLHLLHHHCSTVPCVNMSMCFFVSPCRVGRISWTKEKSVFLNAAALIYKWNILFFVFS